MNNGKIVIMKVIIFSLKCPKKYDDLYD